MPQLQTNPLHHEEETQNTNSQTWYVHFLKYNVELSIIFYIHA